MRACLQVCTALLLLLLIIQEVLDPALTGTLSRHLFEDHWREKLSQCRPHLVFALPGIERQDSVLSGLKVRCRQAAPSLSTSELATPPCCCCAAGNSEDC